MTDKIEVQLWIATNRVGSKERRTIKVDREDWDAMSDLEKDQYLWEELMNQAGSMYDWGYEVA